MAVNYADGMMITGTLFFPVAAGVGAAHAGAGVLSLAFIPLGLAVGVGVIHVGRKLLYSIMRFGMDMVSKIPKGPVQQIITLPFFAAYMIFPLAIVWGGVFGVWAGSIWTVRHFL